MSKYTISLQEMKDFNIPIFNEDIENIVNQYIETGTDAYFTSAYWEKFKERYYRKYKYREIAGETEEIYYDYFIQVFEENIDLFKNFWHNYKINDITSNNVISNINDLVSKDLPMSEYDDLDVSASFKSHNSNIVRGMNNVSELEQMNAYVEKLKDLDDAFLEKFNICFMNIY